MNNYKIKWTQPYTEWDSYRVVRELEQLKADLVERVLDYKDFTEAKQELARIMAK
jgi:hypothetical protein